MVEEFQIQKEQAADPFMRKNSAPIMVNMAKDETGKVKNSHHMQFLEERYDPTWLLGINGVVIIMNEASS